MMHTLAILTSVMLLSPEGPRRILLGADLSRTVVSIERLDGASVGVVDERGVRRTVESKDILAIYGELAARPLVSEGSLAIGLADGQRIIGRLGAIEGDQESIRIVHPLLGELRVALDQTLWITNADAPAPSAAVSEDTVVLANGDLLTGFVVGFVPARRDTGTSVEAIVENSAGATQQLAIERVSTLIIANPTVAPRGARVWLADGSSVGMREVSAAGAGMVQFVPELGEAAQTEADPTEDAMPHAPPARGMAIVDHVVGWMPDAGRLVALADARVLSVQPVEPRPWTDQPRFGDATRSPLGAPDIRFPGPARVEWELPDRTDGLACVVTMPEAYRDWGDCEVVILTAAASGGGWRERWRGHVNAAQPSLPVALDLADQPRRLLVAVEPGAFGPVQDRPTLVTPVLRIAPISGP